MKIAQIAPLCEAVPPPLYGGTERIVAWLTDALVDLGHEVTLFASAESETRAELVPCRDQALRMDRSLKSDVAAHLAMLHEVRERAAEFDVLHFHVDLLHFPLFSDCADRTLTTLHGRLDLKDLPGAYHRWPRYPLVSISDSQRRPLRFANWRGTVHHGMPESLLPFSPRPGGGYLAFLGRICADKGILPAIEIARQAGMPLKVAAKVDPADQDYFDQEVKPVLEVSPHVDFIGEINDSQKQTFLGEAKALVFPISWPEPFGLVMIESMACGTPVVAFNCGSVPEIMEDGVTGFVVETVEKAAAAIPRLDDLSRSLVRARFEKRFSVEAMARAYVEIYENLPADDSVAVAAE